MLQNKIYQNFTKEILKTFFIILFGLTIIAWTVRAVNFLDLIVESGYSVITYFQYSFLNFFGIMTKFIPLSFLLAIVVFILKQIQENEFTILWVSGIKKLKVVNLFFLTSIIVLFIYLIFSTIVTPFALNKSRYLLNKDGYSSFLPTVRIQQFSDSFEGFTLIVEKKFKNELKNVFIHDSSKVLNGISAIDSDSSSATIIASKGIVEEKKMVLINGQILTTSKDSKNNLIKFEQLKINLKDLTTGTIKVPKLQETLTFDLISCLYKPETANVFKCGQDGYEEIKTVLNRRLYLPLYIPVVSLLCSLLLIGNNKKKIFINKYTVFALSFAVLVYSELLLRYTGMSKLITTLFIFSPIVLAPIIYMFLVFKFNKEFK